MANNSLDKFIKDLQKVEANFNTITKKKKDNVIGQIIKEIGIRTAYDTGVTRGALKNILRKELKLPDLALELDTTVYNYWEKIYGKRSKDDASYIFDVKADGTYRISIIDDGFYGQAEDGIVSSKHPRQDPLVVPRQVDNVCDLMNSKQILEIEKSIDDLVIAIVEAIETGKVSK